MNNGPLFVLAASVLWGTTGTAQALAPAGAHPAVIGALRLVVGGAALLVLAGVRPEALKTLKGTSRTALLFAAAGMAAYQAFFFKAVLATGVAVGTVVTMGSPPVFTGMMAWLLFKEKPGWRWAVATLMAVAGCSILVLGGSDHRSVNVMGIALALCSGSAYAVFAVAARQMVQQMDSQVAMAVVACLGALMLGPVLLLSDIAWVLTPRGLAMVLYLGLIATAAPYGLFVFGLRSITAATAASLTLAEPLTASLLGIFFLKEPLTGVAGSGMVLLLVGLAVLSIGSPRRTRKKLPPPLGVSPAE